MAESSTNREFPPLLPAGFHVHTIPELRERCVNAFPLSQRRPALMQGLETVIFALIAGRIVGELWIDGSFVTEKIDPEDVDLLLRVPAEIYDADPARRAVIDWASREELLQTHFCDSYKWVEYNYGHPLFRSSEADRRYWTNWYGKSPLGVEKGIVVIHLSTGMP